MIARNLALFRDRKDNPYLQGLWLLRPVFVQVAVASALVNILMLTSPIFMLQIYDRVLGSGSVPTLLGLLVVAILLYTFMGAFDLLRLRLLSRAGYRLDREVAEKAYQIWVHSAVSSKPGQGRPLNDLATLRGFAASPALLGFFDLPWVPFYLLITFLIHPWLGVLTLAGALFVTALAILGQWLTAKSLSEAAARDASESFFVEQGHRGAETVVALGMVDRLGRRWRGMHDEGLALGQSGGDWSEVISTISKIFRMFLQSAVLALAAYLVLQQQISAGMIIAASTIAGRALAPVDQVIGQWRSIIRAREAHFRLIDALHGQTDPDNMVVELPEPKGGLTVKDLTKLAMGAASGPRRPPILTGVSFALEPGDALGVIGPSASGKSSLAKCIVGAWAPDAGETRLDGATPAQWGANARARHIGFMPQTVELLTGSIKDNIARFDPEARDDEVVRAAQMAGVHEMILQFPEGYGSKVGFGGMMLSGGQAQRVALARALYGNPKLVVLDEPNSNLDAAGDEALAQALATLRGAGVTVIVMAHRPAAIAAVNKLLVLQNGTVAHFGDRDDILALATRPAILPSTAPKAETHVRAIG